MQIRYAVEQDYPVIIDIYNQAIPTHQITADLDYATLASRRDWFNFHLHSKKYPIWVVEVSATVVGWFSFSPFYERAAFAPTVEISIYLDSTVKGQGLGEKIVGFMQDKMLKLEVYTLMAYVFELNQPSVKLLQKCGFECWGRFPNIANMSKDKIGEEWRTFLVLAYQQGI